jgi:hypothetical protein
MHKLHVQIIKRLLVYCFTFFLLWPVISLFSTAIDPNKAKAIHVPISIAFFAAAGGTLLLMPDFICVGIILMVPCLVFFSLLDSSGMLQPLDYPLSFSLEPILLFMSCFFALLLYYPILLHYPLLSPIRPLPVWLATIVIGVIVLVGSVLYASPGSRFKVSLSIGMAGLLLVSFCEFCNSYRPGNHSLNKTSAIVLLGLDSLSYSDDLSIISNWAQSNQGTVYQQAITPGLLTNSVWTSLIAMQPVDRHGVFHAFQRYYPEDGKTMVDAARKAGYLTISMFPDQFSCWIASETDFDVHRDGPIGWRQIATACVEDSSVLLPLIRPLLPKFPFSSVPKNHIGTYNYDLGTELDDIFSHTGKTFIAAHNTYLHSTRYAKYSELSHDEIINVLKAKVGEINDKTLDWQYRSSSDDPIQTRKWKIVHLQKNLITSLERTGFLKHGGRLVIFSDHGDRARLDDSNFTNPQYHHVLFVSFGLPKYSDPEQPVSLLDIPGIIGFKKYSKSPSVVEFTLSRPDEWVNLIKSAKLDWDGTVGLDNELLSDIFKRLKSYDLTSRHINFPLNSSNF